MFYEGWSPDARYPRSFLKEAHLLHWNGHFKPWDYPCVHLDLWEKWFIPDPTGTFTLVRPKDWTISKFKLWSLHWDKRLELSILCQTIVPVTKSYKNKLKTPKHNPVILKGVCKMGKTRQRWGKRQICKQSPFPETFNSSVDRSQHSTTGSVKY